MPTRNGTLFVSAVTDGQVAKLRELLRSVESECRNAFATVETLHFARWVVTDPSTDAHGEPIRPKLVFATDHDGAQQPHLEDLLGKMAPLIDRIYAHCEGYPDAPDAHRRLAYFKACIIDFGTSYDSTAPRTVADIQNEARLYEALQEFLDANGAALAKNPPAQIRERIREFVAGRPDLAWALQPPPRANFAKYWIATIATLLLSLLLLPVTLPLTIVWLLLVRYHESREKQAQATSPPERIRRLTSREDFIAHNQLTIVGNVKPTRFRLVTLKLVLKAFYFLASLRVPFKNSFIGVRTIHFGRFALIDSDRRLMFMSYYDGSWESYLGDFVDRVAFGISSVWSNAEGFPATRFLVTGGARREQIFKALVRDNQLDAEIWYSAYETLTVRNIKSNAAIRAGLSGDLDGDALQRWLQRL